jgi:nicotinamide mononucleotide (NMN) deamidase PncC
MPDVDTPLISAIHRSGHALVLAMTGGGATVIGELLAVPGGSASVLEAVVPYSWSALIEWLGGAPDQACSERTARAMAMAALQRARLLADDTMAPEKLIGVGCTASLASDRPKRGAHRYYVALQSYDGTTCYAEELEKGLRSRAEEEAIVMRAVLQLVAKHCGVPVAESLSSTFQPAHPAARDLLMQRVGAVLLQASPTNKYDVVEQLTTGEARPGRRLLFPGAFHPRHAGHCQMAEWAAQQYGLPVEWELSLFNVEKPPLDYVEIAARLSGFEAGERVWLTRAPTFVEKARFFPGATFLVGVDTIVRIADARYYGQSEVARDEALAEIAALGCRFVVFGRRSEQGFLTLDDVSLPPALKAICDAVPEQAFRADVSSTELRRQQEQQQQ